MKKWKKKKEMKTKTKSKMKKKRKIRGDKQEDKKGLKNGSEKSSYGQLKNAKNTFFLKKTSRRVETFF